MRISVAAGATTRARLLFVATGLALVVAVAYGSVSLVVFATVVAMPLLLARPGHGSQSVVIECEPPTRPIVEGEPFHVIITVTFAAVRESALGVVHGNDWLEVQQASIAESATEKLSWTVRLTAKRWGPVAAPAVSIVAVSHRGLRAERAELRLPVELVALPRPTGLASLGTMQARRGRVGNHPSSHPGAGIEFHGIRPYHPGDLPRRIHWPTSTRRGDLYVTEFAAESAIDTVVIIDAFTEAGPPGDSTLDHSVRGAAGTAKAMIDNGDRVGLAMLGGTLGWLAPATSQRQWYRIVTTALGVRIHESFVTPDIAAIPRVALPAGAQVLVFTPLLDDRVMSVLTDLRRRRFAVVVIDVLPAPALPRRPSREETLALRLWQVRRAGKRAQLATIGCMTVPWTGNSAIRVPARAGQP